MIFARFNPPRVPTIRCQRRLSTGPRADWACPICTFPAGVKGPWANAQEARGCRNDVTSRRALGVFLEFRLIPVLLWSYTAVTLGTAILAIARSWAILLFVIPGFVSGLFYTLPPVRTAYRPFAGELLGGFLGVHLCVLGGYYVQALTIPPAAVAAAVGYACVCVSMLLMHHYLDVEADLAATPPKRTTIAYLGREAGKAYTLMYAVGALFVFAVLGFWSLPVLVAVPFAALALVAHLRTRPGDPGSVTKNELAVIQLGIAGGLAASVALAPALIGVLVVALAGYVIHLRLA